MSTILYCAVDRQFFYLLGRFEDTNCSKRLTSSPFVGPSRIVKDVASPPDSQLGYYDRVGGRNPRTDSRCFESGVQMDGAH